MKLLLRIWFVCSLLLLGCGLSSGPSDQQKSALKSPPGTHEEACTVISDYADRYEIVYLQYQGSEMRERLSEVENEYHRRMAKLREAGKWTPSQETGTTIKLSFLMGEFHGALQSCKIERSRKDTTSIGCDEVKWKKEAMKELCLGSRLN